MSKPTIIRADAKSLIEIWKVLENLTVSLDRLGEYERQYGEEAAKNALEEYMQPLLVQQIAHARGLIVTLFEQHDSALLDYLEQLAENETTIGYWDGPRAQGKNE